MIADFITIDREAAAALEAGELLQWIRDLRSVYERGSRIREKMKHNFDDSNPQSIVWSALEAKWGVPTGKGADVYTYIDGTVGSMEGVFQTSAARDLTARVG